MRQKFCDEINAVGERSCRKFFMKTNVEINHMFVLYVVPVVKTDIKVRVLFLSS